MVAKKTARLQRGETIIETLAAILIVTLASMVLLTMTLAATRINRTAGEADKAFRQELLEAETQANGAAGTVTLRQGGRDYPYDVAITGKDDALTSYVKKEAAP